MGRPLDAEHDRMLIAQVLEQVPAADRAAVPLARLCRYAGADEQAAEGIGRVLARMLMALGVVQIIDEPQSDLPLVKAATRRAELFMLSLAQYLRHDRPVLTNWDRTAAIEPPYRLTQPIAGPQLLYLMEQQRLRLDPDAVPLRRVQVAQVVVKTTFRLLGNRYLVIYDPGAGQYQLPGGYQRDGDETPRETAIRELEEELPRFAFDSVQDSLAVLGELEATQLSQTFGAVTAYQITYFQLNTTRSHLAVSPGSRWVRERDLRSSSTKVGGRSLNTTGVRRLLEQLPGGLTHLAAGLRPSRLTSLAVAVRDKRWELFGVAASLLGVVASVLLYLAGR